MDPKKLLGDAQLLFLECKIDECVDTFKQALDAGADPFMVYISIGAAYMKTKEPDKAIENFSKAIEINKDNPRPFYYRGLTYLYKDENEKAVADLSEALSLKQDFHTARFARATAYFRLEKYEEAAIDIKQVMPQMETNIQEFADNYGIIRMEMFNVISKVREEGKTPGMTLSEEDIATLKKWIDLK